MDISTIRSIGIGLGVAAAGVAAFAWALDLKERESVDDLTDRLFKKFDHDESGSLEYGHKVQLLDDERFAKETIHDSRYVYLPATSVSDPAIFGGQLIQRFDTDHDGILTRPEAHAGYALLDKDGNGFVGGLFTNDPKPEPLPWMAPKMLDYTAPSTNVGITEY